GPRGRRRRAAWRSYSGDSRRRFLLLDISPVDSLEPAPSRHRLRAPAACRVLVAIRHWQKLRLLRSADLACVSAAVREPASGRRREEIRRQSGNGSEACPSLLVE